MRTLSTSAAGGTSGGGVLYVRASGKLTASEASARTHTRPSWTRRAVTVVTVRPARSTVTSTSASLATAGERR